MVIWQDIKVPQTQRVIYMYSKLLDIEAIIKSEYMIYHKDYHFTALYTE